MGNYQGVSGIGIEFGQRYQITFSQKTFKRLTWHVMVKPSLLRFRRTSYLPEKG